MSQEEFIWERLRSLSVVGQNISQVLSYIGNTFALVYFATPLIQIIRLYKGDLKASDIPLFLLLTIIFNCLFWLLNAFSSDDKLAWLPLLISNTFGLILNLTLLFLYLFLFLEKNMTKFAIFSLFVLNLVIEIGYLMFRYIITKDRGYQESTFHLIGLVATIINVLMYSSPLQNIKKLIKTGKYEMLPIVTIVSGFFATLTFLAQGIINYVSAEDIKGDEQIFQKRNATETIVSNGVSFVLLTIQAIIYIYYFLRPPKTEFTSNDIKIGENNQGLIQGDRNTINPPQEIV